MVLALVIDQLACCGWCSQYNAGHHHFSGFFPGIQFRLGQLEAYGQFFNFIGNFTFIILPVGFILYCCPLFALQCVFCFTVWLALSTYILQYCCTNFFICTPLNFQGCHSYSCCVCMSKTFLDMLICVLIKVQQIIMA